MLSKPSDVDGSPPDKHFTLTAGESEGTGIFYTCWTKNGSVRKSEKGDNFECTEIKINVVNSEGGAKSTEL